MLAENKLIDQIAVDETGVVHVREAIVISRNGAEITRTYHRATLVKGQDVSSWPQKVQRICAASWAEVK